MSNTDTNQATDDTQKASTRTLSEQHAQHGTATSPIISDTNQASEDELRTLDEILSQAFTDGASDTMWQDDRHVEIFATAKKELLAIIRTEKLKLLAEVRERVVGEHKPKTRGLTQNPNNAAYWTKASQTEFDLIEQQLNNLDKLEAEL